MGRWTSDAFMHYMRKQVLSLSHGISSRMLAFEQFYMVPDFVHTAADGDSRSRSNTNLGSLRVSLAHTRICVEASNPIFISVIRPTDISRLSALLHSLVAVILACKGKVYYL